MEAVFTTSEFNIGYKLLGYIDFGAGISVDGITYNNTSFNSCEVLLINLIQYESQPVKDEVQKFEA